jgi:aldose 1-epimerase
METVLADLLELHDGDLACLVNPSCGGGIARFDLMRDDVVWPLLRPAPDGNRDPLDLGCFPLLPFANRIAGGRFNFAGNTIALPLNLPPHPHAMHGHGWQASWKVVERTGSVALLRYRHRADAWPFAYSAELRYDLADGALNIGVVLVNQDDHAMPAGIGLHPFFPKPPGTVLTAGVAGVWLNDGTGLPSERMPLPDGWTFPTGVPMDQTVIDNGFDGWDRRAVLDWPDRGFGLAIEADGAFDHLQIYAPFGRDFLCVEPVSHMTDAVNRAARGQPDTGLRILQPGETLAGTVRLRLLDSSGPRV